LTLTITNPNSATTLGGVAVAASPLPANLNGSNPATTCGGTATFAGGSLSLSGGSLAASANCTVTLTVSSTTAGTYFYTTGMASASGTASSSPYTTPTGLTVLASSNVALASSANPSSFGQAVTFTATVTGTSPTGTVTFKDGTTVLGTGPVSGGHASFTISTLALGSHAITAAYSGDGSNTPSTSAVLNQSVGVPADSIKLQALQIAVTRLVAQGSGSATSGAIDNAISEGFNDNSPLISGSDNGVHVNFAAEPEKPNAVEERVGDAFAALGYAKRDQQPVFKAPVQPVLPKEWLAWLDVHGTGWNTSVQTGDIRGSQVNALVGLTRRLTPNFLVGVFGGYENFDYTSQLLNGRLKGDGWTAGGYIGWRVVPGLRFDAGVARSGVSYDGTAGTANATFPGQRWLLTTGLTGTYKTAPGFVIEPSAKVYALWEHEDAYTDNLGIGHPDRDFSTGRASLGAKAIYPWLTASSVTIAPYLGLYGDYYFNQDDAVSLGAPNLLPTEFVHGLSARVTSGLAVSLKDGKTLSFGGEYGGIGNDFKVWSVRGRAAVPF
jgi:hypothetical protein